MLTDDELDRYARHLVLPQVGGLGQQRLRAARIAIVGAGGIGAAALPALVGAGVGHLTIIDDDFVDLSNLQRQSLYRTSDVGQPKAAMAAAFVADRNPHVQVRMIAERLTPDNAAGVLAGHDLILDGTDNFATRLLVSDTATGLSIPLVSAAAQQFQGQVALFRGFEPTQPCYRCFVGDAFDADDCDNCAELGVMGALTGTVGNFAALVAIRAVVGITPDAAGKLHLFDGVTLAWRVLNLPADPACKVCAR